MSTKATRETHYHDGLSLKLRRGYIPYRSKHASSQSFDLIERPTTTRCCYSHDDINKDHGLHHCEHFNRKSHKECMVEFGSDCEECQGDIGEDEDEPEEWASIEIGDGDPIEFAHPDECVVDITKTKRNYDEFKFLLGGLFGSMTAPFLFWAIGKLQMIIKGPY